MATLTNAPIPAAVLATDGVIYQFPDDEHTGEFEAKSEVAGQDTLLLVPQTPALARPLYDLEAHLAALVDTEDIVPVELEQEYALELHATLVATVEKRDRVGQFLGHLKSQIAFRTRRG